MTIYGSEVRAPSAPAVAEHVTTLPMLLAIIAFLCGVVAMAGFWSADTPWFKFFLGINTGMPFLIAQLGQLWHSRNVQNQMQAGRQAIAAGIAAPEPPKETE